MIITFRDALPLENPVIREFAGNVEEVKPRDEPNRNFLIASPKSMFNDEEN